MSSWKLWIDDHKLVCALLALILLAALLVLTGLPFYAATAESSFTGVVTYRSGKNVYLQSGSQGILAL